MSQLKNKQLDLASATEYVDEAKQLNDFKVNATQRSLTFRVIVIVINIILFFLLLNYLPFEYKVNGGIAILAVAAVFWVTEAIHLVITSLLIPVLAVFLGILDTSKALSGFSSPTIFLYFGGFALASALRFQGLDQYFANRVIILARGNYLAGSVLLMAVTAFLSMWMNNTSTTSLLIPIALSIVSRIEGHTSRGSFVFMLLGVAYSASIGGMGTVVGSIPNALVAAQLGIGFADWLVFGVPFMMIAGTIAFILMYIILRPNFKGKFTLKKEEFIWTKARITTLIIFATTAFLWVFGKQINIVISPFLGFARIASFDVIIAILCTISLVISGCTSWNNIQKQTEWGALLLFGGGITLSIVLVNSQASLVIAEQLRSAIQNLGPFLIVLIIAGFTVFLTEFMSNTATSNLLIPIFIAFANIIELNPLTMAAIVSLSSSAAFMLPISTPPNAMAYSTGYIKITEMVKIGVFLNIILIFVLAILAEYVWGITQ